MKTQLSQDTLASANGERINEILRKCVHCGFCLATCPTYQITGDELDSPRGRIYQMKLMFEGQTINHHTQLHLDRCLTCRSCESTCPSGVDYAELLDYGRLKTNTDIPRPFSQQLKINLLNAVLPFPARNKALFKTGHALAFLLPSKLKQKVPKIRVLKEFKASQTSTNKSVFLLEGCVQSTISPNTNAAAQAVLNALGYQVIREASPKCCGALSHHSGKEKNTHQFIITQLQQWQTLDQQQPLDAIISTASGCGVMLKDYHRLLTTVEKQQYLDVLNKIKDISELLDVDQLKTHLKVRTHAIALHEPCTLKHGQKLADNLNAALLQLGYQVKTPQDAHLCCGSAGTYSIMQEELSKQLQHNKITALEATKSEEIVTANVGCEHHLASVAHLPVKHWVEIIAEDLI